jgi:ADP-ribose pyrophosphatase
MKKTGEKILHKGKWLSLKETTYISESGQEINWESIERTNTNKSVVIVSKLMPSERYLFIRQYRPAINNYIIGFPAGLVEGDDLEAEALRELKEETGYSGTVKGISPVIHSNAALLTDTVRLVNIEINEEDEENLKPKQCLEIEEEIEVVLVQRDNVKKFLLEEQEKGTAMSVGPWCIFCGLEGF